MSKPKRKRTARKTDLIAEIIKAPPVTGAYHLDAAFAAFKLRWLALPPLVRASTAFHVVRENAHQAVGHQRATEEGAIALLPRRKRVLERFVEADLALVDFFISLTRQADDEAVARGIDADIEGPTFGAKDD